jgi:hypothetical protein
MPSPTLFPQPRSLPGPPAPAGMLVNPESMPDWISWSHWLSIFFYAYSALMINELTGIKIDFAVGGGGGGGGGACCGCGVGGGGGVTRKGGGACCV